MRNMMTFPTLSNKGSVCTWMIPVFLLWLLYQSIKWMNDWNNATDHKIMVMVLNKPMNVKAMTSGRGKSLTDIPSPMNNML